MVQPGLRQGRARADSDYADMGTAFGLDASLDTLPMPEPGTDARNDKGRPPSSGAGLQEALSALLPRSGGAHFGSTTLSITWITPLSAAMSA
ncbi:hypothetical protein FSC37_20840 [Piscinibacter aquaticus]|uniref:Uncharacterized protein n=1 Tax=Piscinibacter aquaticus TaxID=392597 RepID=A0A5C6U2P0_9BURK|nr:hypothetical protein FSC37_20840 [Piscinibacter aquaticus]